MAQAVYHIRAGARELIRGDSQHTIRAIGSEFGGSMPATSQRAYVGASDRMPEGGRLVVDVGDATIGIFRVDGKLYAYLNICAHQGGPVCQGKIIPRVTEVIDEGGESRGFAFDESRLHIVCPWHGFEYDIKTGEHPGRRTAKLIRVTVEESADGIYVTV
jgi:nitrite reductase/ring-hydroxylating ferredoxin subunit